MYNININSPSMFIAPFLGLLVLFILILCTSCMAQTSHQDSLVCINGEAGKKKKHLARNLKERQRSDGQGLSKYNNRGRENHVGNKVDQNKNPSSLEYQSFSERNETELWASHN